MLWVCSCQRNASGTALQVFDQTVWTTASCSRTMHIHMRFSRRRSMRKGCRLLSGRANIAVSQELSQMKMGFLWQSHVFAGQGESAQPRAEASPDAQQRHCCFFRQCLRAMPAHQYLDQVFLQPPCRQASSPQRDAKLVSQGCFHQPSELYDSVATFSLTPSRLGKDTWHCRVVVSRQHLRQQQKTPAAASTTNASTRTPHVTTT